MFNKHLTTLALRVLIWGLVMANLWVPWPQESWVLLCCKRRTFVNQPTGRKRIALVVADHLAARCCSNSVQHLFCETLTTAPVKRNASLWVGIDGSKFCTHLWPKVKVSPALIFNPAACAKCCVCSWISRIAFLS